MKPQKTTELNSPPEIIATNAVDERFTLMVNNLRQPDSVGASTCYLPWRLLLNTVNDS